MGRCVPGPALRPWRDNRDCWVSWPSVFDNCVILRLQTTAWSHVGDVGTALPLRRNRRSDRRVVTAAGIPNVGPGALAQRPVHQAVPVMPHDEVIAAMLAEEWRISGRWRWLTSALLILGLASFVVNQETYAVSTFVVRNPGNFFETGYVEVTVDRPGTAIISAADLLAGESATGVVTLVNSGSLDIGMVKMTTTSTDQSSSVLLTDYVNGLQLGVDRCTAEWTGPSPYTCSGTPTYNVFACKALNRDIVLGYRASVLPPGGKDFLRVRMKLPEAAARESMGLRANIRFTWFVTGENAPLDDPVCSLATPTPGPAATLAAGVGDATSTITPTVTKTRTPVPTTTPVGAHGDIAGTPFPTATPNLDSRLSPTPLGAHGEIATPGPAQPTPTVNREPRMSPTPYVLHLTPTVGSKMKVRAVEEGADGPFPETGGYVP